jgi:hypothetical protein
MSAETIAEKYTVGMLQSKCEAYQQHNFINAMDALYLSGVAAPG